MDKNEPSIWPPYHAFYIQSMLFNTTSVLQVFYPSVSDRRTTSIMCADSDLTGWLQAAVLLSSIHPRISALLHRALLRCPTSQPAGLDFLTCSLHCVFLTELITP